MLFYSKWVKICWILCFHACRKRKRMSDYQRRDSGYLKVGTDSSVEKL